jgi:3-dehydroquinate synthetase
MSPERQVVELELGHGRGSRIEIGRGLLGELDLPDAAALIVDGQVLALHSERLPPSWGPPRIGLPAGEDAKRWGVLGSTLEALAEAGLDRGDRIAVVGGGAACDLGGLAAALYLRGVSWIACPTTLLAMIDASVGGKTAVDLGQGKNLAGAFWQPGQVLADIDFLATLPPEELRSGLGEATKTAMIAGGPLFQLLESGAQALLAGDPAATTALIAECVRTKSEVVASDEFESGGRAVLNLGHTFAHAAERVAGFGRLPHGVCVAAGLGAALELAGHLWILEDADLPGRTARLARELGLPAGLRELREMSGLDLNAEALRAAMGQDKKRRGGGLRFVLPRGLGRVEHGIEVDERSLAQVLA